MLTSSREENSSFSKKLARSAFTGFYGPTRSRASVGLACIPILMTVRNGRFVRLDDSFTGVTHFVR